MLGESACLPSDVLPGYIQLSKDSLTLVAHVEDARQELAT